MNNCVIYPDIYEFQTQIQSIDYDSKKDITQIQLKTTYFFPTEGGQPADKGFINEYEIINVQTKEKHSKEIYHTIKGQTTLKVEDNVNCKIDKQYRQMNAISHSGQHLFSSFADKINCSSESFTISYPFSTIELHRKEKITQNELQLLIEQTNNAILQNYQIDIQIIENIEDIPQNLRKNYNFVPLRLITIKNEKETLDICPCCGSHIQNTQQLGSFMIWKYDYIKNGVKIYFSFGQQNIQNMLHYNNILQQTSQIFNCGPENLLDSVQKLKNQSKITDKKLSDLIKNQKENIEESCFIKINDDICGLYNDFLSEKDLIPINQYLQEIHKEYNQYVVIIVNQQEKTTQISIISKNNKAQDTAELFKQKYEQNVIKCGGNQKRYNLNLNVKISRKELNFN